MRGAGRWRPDGRRIDMGILHRRGKTDFGLGIWDFGKVAGIKFIKPALFIFSPIRGSHRSSEFRDSRPVTKPPDAQPSLDRTVSEADGWDD